MKNSFIINIIYRLFVAITEFYKFSYTNKAINKISLTLKRYFSNSAIYKILTKNITGKNTEHSLIVQLLEKLLQSIIKPLNSIFLKGMNGSLFFRLIRSFENAVKNNSLSFITYIIIGFIIVINGIYILKGIINFKLIMISIILVVLSALFSYLDVRTGIKNSFIIKGFTKILGTGFEE
jgi:hypothetical protein